MSSTQSAVGEMQSGPVSKASLARSERKPIVVADKTPKPDALPDPGVLGLFGFAFATILSNLQNLGLIGPSDLMVGTAIFLGGAAQIIAGLLSYPSRSLFGLTTFGGFGLFWVVAGFGTLVQATGKIPAASAAANFWYLFIWAGFVFALLIATLKSPRTLTCSVGFAYLLLLGLAFSALTGSAVLLKLSAVCGLIAAVFALYIATASLWNETYGRTILPLGERVPH